MGQGRPRKLCCAASAGGHLDQLLALSDGWASADVVFVTSLDVAGNALRRQGSVHVIGECNREHPLRVLAVLLRCLRIASTERFDAVISTGAAPGLLMSLASKLFGAKVVWVDSIANIEKLSLSGRLIRPWADLMLTQWPEVAELYSNVDYVGELV